MTSYKVLGIFSGYEIREELREDGSVRVSFHMSRPPYRLHSEIWSWTGNPKALVPAPAGEEKSPEQRMEIAKALLAVDGWTLEDALGLRVYKGNTRLPALIFTKEQGVDCNHEPA